MAASAIARAYPAVVRYPSTKCQVPGRTHVNGSCQAPKSLTPKTGRQTATRSLGYQLPSSTNENAPANASARNQRITREQRGSTPSERKLQLHRGFAHVNRQVAQVTNTVYIHVHPCGHKVVIVAG